MGVFGFLGGGFGFCSGLFSAFCQRALDGNLLGSAQFVKAPPEGGRANAELIEFLAEEWGVPKRDLTLAAGAADRRPATRYGCSTRATARLA
mgnify:CR=1 FL=1